MSATTILVFAVILSVFLSQEPFALSVGAHREVGGFDNGPGQILVPVLGQDRDYRKDRPCVRRYLAVRIRRRQGELFADGSTVKHFAIVTNLEGGRSHPDPWNREKAGTVEHCPSCPEKRVGRRDAAEQ